MNEAKSRAASKIRSAPAEVAAKDAALFMPFLKMVLKHAQQDDHAEGWFNSTAKRPRWNYKRAGRHPDEAALKRHLNGGPPLGVYPMAPGGTTTRLAKYDLDDHDDGHPLPWEEMAAAAQKIIDALHARGLSPWWVRSGGGRGIHIWLLWEEEQLAAAVRYLMHEVLREVGFKPGAGGIAKGQVEVFPTSDRADRRGSSVSMPFGLKSAPLGMELMPTDGLIMPLLASRSVPPPPPGRVKTDSQSGVINDSNRELLRLTSALKHIDSDDYDTWIKFGIAIKRTFGEEGFDAWDEWSKKATNYCGQDEATKRWKGFEPRSEGGVTVRSIYDRARRNKWQDETRPIIVFDPTAPMRMALEAEAALIASGTPLYQQAGTLVRVIKTEKKSDARQVVRRAANALILKPVTPIWFLGKAMEEVRWVKHTKKGDVPTTLPKTVCDLYVDMTGDWEVPHLTATVETPVLFKTESSYELLQTPGYDPRSGLYYDPGSLIFPPIPERPTKEHAREALDSFLNLLKGFPFLPDKVPDGWRPSRNEGVKKSRARSVIISAFLSGFVRRTMKAVPMHAADAAVRGTGKGMLLNTVAVIHTGREAAAIAWVREEHEQRKHILSILRDGDPVILFDNIDTVVGGAPLNIMLTQEVLKGRVLGKSQDVEVPTNCLVLATGNNLVFEADTTRRVVRCRLDARMETPEDRQFSENAQEEAKRRRGELVVAGLTVLLAYLEAGQPLRGKVDHVGSYEDWTMIREVIIWLGEPDPAETMKDISADDPVANVLMQMMDCWEECYGSHEVRLADTITDARGGADRFSYSSPDAATRAKRRLNEAMMEALAGKKEPSEQAMGYWFKRHDMQIKGDRYFKRQGDSKNKPRSITLVGAKSGRGVLNQTQAPKM